MFALLGLQSCNETMDVLLRRAGIDTADDGRVARKFAYNRWLAILQGPIACSPGTIPEFVDDAAIEASLLAAFIDDGESDDLLDPITSETIRAAIAARDPGHVRRNLNGAERARARLHEVAPGWGSLFDLVITCVFCVNLSGNNGGSTARAIGSIWINAPEAASRDDLVEFLVHEATHHLTFLDHQCRRHYLAGGSAATAVSAIRGTRRPIACVLDSLLVGIEILALRVYFLGEPIEPRMHPNSIELLDGCFVALDSLSEAASRGGILSDRGLFLLNRAERTLSVVAADLNKPGSACFA